MNQAQHSKGRSWRTKKARLAWAIWQDFSARIVLLCFWVVFPSLVRRLNETYHCVHVATRSPFMWYLSRSSTGFSIGFPGLSCGSMDPYGHTRFHMFSIQVLVGYIVRYNPHGLVLETRLWRRGNEETMTQKKGQTHIQTVIEWAVRTPVEDTYYEGQKLQHFLYIYIYSTRSRHCLVLVGGISPGEGSWVAVSGSYSCLFVHTIVSKQSYTGWRKALQFLQASQGKALRTPWLWGIGVLDMAVSMSIHVLVGLHLLSTIFR